MVVHCVERSSSARLRHYWLVGPVVLPLHTIPETEFVSLLNWPEDNQPYLTLPFNDHKITSAVWGPLGEFVIAGHENGEINQISAKVEHHAVTKVASLACGTMWHVFMCDSLVVWGDPEESQGALQAHQRHPDLCGPNHVHQRLQGQHGKGENRQSRSAHFGCLFTTCDNFLFSFQLFDSTSLDHIKTFKTERPVNSAAISPIMDHVSGQWKIHTWPISGFSCDHRWPSILYFIMKDCVTCSQVLNSSHFCGFSGGDGWWTGSHGGHNHVHQDRKVRSKVRSLSNLEEVSEHQLTL